MSNDTAARQAGHPEVVFFDLGEVLATPARLHDALAEAAGRDRDLVERAYWAHRDPYDRGGEARTFWSAVLEDVSVDARDDIIAELTRIDTVAWTTIRDDAADLLQKLHKAAIPIGILSNATIEMAAAARTTSWAKWITHWFFSAELLMAKPDPLLYLTVAHDIGVPPARIVFLDDRQVNVDGARKAGWNAHLWTSGDQGAAVLSHLGLPVEA